MMARPTHGGLRGSRRSLARQALDSVTRVVFFAFHKEHAVCGVPVVISDPTADEEECIRLFEQAMDLLAHVMRGNFGQFANTLST